VSVLRCRLPADPLYCSSLLARVARYLAISLARSSIDRSTLRHRGSDRPGLARPHFAHAIAVTMAAHHTGSSVNKRTRSRVPIVRIKEIFSCEKNVFDGFLKSLFVISALHAEECVVAAPAPI
jgi:hypothetical protein